MAIIFAYRQGNSRPAVRIGRKLPFWFYLVDHGLATGGCKKLCISLCCTDIYTIFPMNNLSAENQTPSHGRFLTAARYNCRPLGHDCRRENNERRLRRHYPLPYCDVLSLQKSSSWDTGANSTKPRGSPFRRLLRPHIEFIVCPRRHGTICLKWGLSANFWLQSASDPKVPCSSLARSTKAGPSR